MFPSVQVYAVDVSRSLLHCGWATYPFPCSLVQAVRAAWCCRCCNQATSWSHTFDVFRPASPKSGKGDVSLEATAAFGSAMLAVVEAKVSSTISRYCKSSLFFPVSRNSDPYLAQALLPLRGKISFLPREELGIFFTRRIIHCQWNARTRGFTARELFLACPSLDWPQFDHRAAKPISGFDRF